MRLTLRRRLVIGTVGLLTMTTILIGVASVLALQGFLMDRLDDQLAAATNRSEGGFDDEHGAPPPEPPPGLDFPTPEVFLARSGQPAGTLGAIILDGAPVTVAVLDAAGNALLLNPAEFTELAAVVPDGEPHTLLLGPTLGEYRVLATEKEGVGVLVTGLPLEDVRATVAQLALLILAIGTASLAVAVTIGTHYVRFALRPLDRVADTAARVSELPLDRDVALAVRVADADADPSTEVGRVGTAFNRMLEHVASALTARQASETKVRTFVADASHELRTPLTSIRGYAELARRSGAQLPEDIAHALGRIESESVRMTGLVEDLLMLARLDEGVRLESVEVDIGRMLVDATSDARAAGPEHEWTLEVPEEPVAVSGDAAGLHQVVANLLANARIHTSPGTRVDVKMERHAGEVLILVADNGAGIPEDLVPAVFERFVRGDGSRSRKFGSTGLGLAIVQAVVEAHAGTVEVRSAPGQTVFRILLPAAPRS
jgi:two-component system OmpR family sensor kinase